MQMSGKGVDFTSNSDRPLIPADGVEHCQRITRQYGTSFYFATQFFPKEIREGIYAIYAFARIPDEIVDDPQKDNLEITRQRLESWINDWREAYWAGRSEDVTVDAIVKSFRKFAIPIEECEAFFRSMLMDLEKNEYSDFRELEDYMYGSAGVIGLMVTRVIGYSDESAFKFAIKLGYAFQLTNFLRDIREDFDQLGRIYMPLEDLARFGLSQSDIAGRVRDRRFAEFMKFQIERNRQLYREALPGIKLLHWRGRLAVRVAFVLYKAILGEIEKADYNVYAGRVRTSRRQKIALSIKALAGVYE